jgi:ArsR family transcriptional regulator
MDNPSLTDPYRCSCTVVHDAAVTAARAAAPAAADLISLAELFKVLSDPTRLRILAALELEELCVCDLVAVLDMTQSAVSHQLAVLRQARLVKTRRDGRIVFYSLDDAHVRAILDVASIHLHEPGGH